VKKTRWVGALLISLLPLSTAAAGWFKEEVQGDTLAKYNSTIFGRVIDYTHNHGRDNRIWSKALYEKRDLYVYLPPGFDRSQCYPIILWLHGFATDEQSFLTQVVPLMDQAMVQGKLPPAIIAAPDGSFTGEGGFCSTGSFFLNSQAGAFEDYLIYDVWDFVVSRYPVRPERQAHVLAGVSMGGFAAFNQGIKHRESFGVVLGVFPPLNLRWVNSKGRYFANFDPKDWGWRTKVDHGHEVVARFYGGLITIRLRKVLDPLFGSGPQALWSVSRENPIEMIDRYHLREGELSMFVAYGGKDEFNLDAQVESFLYLARCRGLTVGVAYDPKGRHNYATAARLFPEILNWLGPLLAPYSPPLELEYPAGASPAP
jgi:S-formylglutathione hydrolase FrmB